MPRTTRNHNGTDYSCKLDQTTRLISLQLQETTTGLITLAVNDGAFSRIGSECLWLYQFPSVLTFKLLEVDQIVSIYWTNSQTRLHSSSAKFRITFWILLDTQDVCLQTCYQYSLDYIREITLENHQTGRSYFTNTKYNNESNVSDHWDNFP